MINGNKSKAEKILYFLIKDMKNKLKLDTGSLKSSIYFLNLIINKIRPVFYLRKFRKNNSKHILLPNILKYHNQFSLAIKSLLNTTRSLKNNKDQINNLYNEIYNILYNKSVILKNKKDFIEALENYRSNLKKKELDF